MPVCARALSDPTIIPHRHSNPMATIRVIIPSPFNLLGFLARYPRPVRLRRIGSQGDSCFSNDAHVRIAADSNKTGRMSLDRFLTDSFRRFSRQRVRVHRRTRRHASSACMERPSRGMCIRVFLCRGRLEMSVAKVAKTFGDLPRRPKLLASFATSASGHAKPAAAYLVFMLGRRYTFSSVQRTKCLFSPATDPRQQCKRIGCGRRHLMGRARSQPLRTKPARHAGIRLRRRIDVVRCGPSYGLAPSAKPVLSARERNRQRRP